MIAETRNRLLVHTAVKTYVEPKQVSWFTSEDYDVECDTAEEALYAYHDHFRDEFDAEYSHPDNQMPTTIIEMNETGEVRRINAFVSFNDCGFYKDSLEAFRNLREIPTLKPISIKPVEFSDELKEEIRLMNSHIGG